MKRVEHRYESGLVELIWIGRCELCGAHVSDVHESLAHCWEEAHRRYGCERRLILDESGRGWLPLVPV